MNQCVFVLRGCIVEKKRLVELVVVGGIRVGENFVRKCELVHFLGAFDVASLVPHFGDLRVEILKM